MMAFLFHTAFYLGILALTAGISLYIWAARNQGPGVKLAKFFGILLMIIVILNMGCLLFYSVKYWTQGYFESPMPMQQMMQNGNMSCQSMMQGMMNKESTPSANLTPASGDAINGPASPHHSAHTLQQQ